MLQKRTLPSREHVFIGSLLSQGFQLAKPSSYLKPSKCYIIPSSTREDAAGEDFFIKLPTEKSTIPIQITQSGIQIFKKFHKPEKSALEKFIAQSESRIRAKRWLCRRNGIIFVLVQDYLGETTNRDLAWSDLKALRYALRSFNKKALESTVSLRLQKNNARHRRVNNECAVEPKQSRKSEFNKEKP